MVQFTKNEAGSQINLYSNPLYGYLVLEETSVAYGKWAKEKKVTSLMKGEVDLLKRIIAQNPKGLPGRIVVNEFLESQIPDEFLAEFNSNLSEEENIVAFAKRSGKDGAILCFDGERIVRFTEYNDDVTVQDVKVRHNNQAEVATFKAIAKIEAERLALETAAALQAEEAELVEEFTEAIVEDAAPVVTAKKAALPK